MMSTTISASTSKKKTMNEKGEEQQQKEKYQMYLNFKWSIGSNNCDKENDTLSTRVPIEMIRNQNQVGGNEKEKNEICTYSDSAFKRIHRRFSGICLFREDWPMVDW
mmetsp:Transcript_25823/g.32541  ORF Transcript_25823/g.32541 Transcript_25823/m.32541 type:complete len:107 (+) Transcript_25823:500-820(+)